MNIKRINELDYINNPEGFYGICSDGNGNTKRYKISVSEGSVDWNASEGEAGYIENRPFFIDSKWKCYFGNNEWEVYSDYLGLYVKQNEYKGIYLDHEINSVYDFGWEHQRVGFSVDGAASIYVCYGDGFPYVVCDDEYFFESEEALNEFCNTCFGMCSINKLEESYLPNTVIKTTPQTLSDDAKNQALSNLGIDPVVLKYMMNPYVIEPENTLPDYLRQLLANYNPLILNLCKIKVEVDVYDDIADATRPKTYFCTPMMGNFADEELSAQLECIIFYDNTYHTYYADIDSDGYIYEIIEKQ